MARVLVVEDDDDVRELIGHRLRAAGHKALLVPDGAAALAAVAEREAPEVVVLDIGLPAADGFEVLADLRALPQLANLPAIFLSARVLEDDVRRGHAMGAAYLTKPFVASALLKAVEQAVVPPAPEEGW